MDFKISGELAQKILNLLQEMPYKVCHQVTNEFLKAINDQLDAAKVPSETSKKLEPVV